MRGAEGEISSAGDLSPARAASGGDGAGRKALCDGAPTPGEGRATVPWTAESGFALIETLAALALGLVVMGLVTSTLQSAAGQLSRARTSATEAEAYSRAADLLAEEAAHAVALPDAFPPGARGVSFALTTRDGATVVHRFTLTQTALTRAETPVIGGKPGLFGAEAPVWALPGQGWTFRYLGPKGWQADWTDPGLPRAFGLVQARDQGAVLMTAAFPTLAAPDCALGPGAACDLGAEVVP